MDYSLPGSSIHGIFQQEYWSGVPLPSPLAPLEPLIYSLYGDYSHAEPFHIQLEE